jgi:hypothetical protein
VGRLANSTRLASLSPIRRQSSLLLRFS